MSDGFIAAGKTGELRPGTMKRVDIGGRRLVLANVDGCVYAADDTCTHEDASLSTGSLRGEWIKCPLHGSRFNVRTGEVLEEPAEENLKVYPVRVERDRILVRLAEQGKP